MEIQDLKILSFDFEVTPSLVDNLLPEVVRFTDYETQNSYQIELDKKRFVRKITYRSEPVERDYLYYFKPVSGSPVLLIIQGKRETRYTDVRGVNFITL